MPTLRTSATIKPNNNKNILKIVVLDLGFTYVFGIIVYQKHNRPKTPK